jgi:tetratricopeptide (TPR) repeat protein
MNIPVELKNAICENKLIVFVGAGLSYNLLNTQGKPLKGWSNLVENILLHLDELGHEQAKALLPLVSLYDPIKVLDLIETNDSFPKGKINEFLKDFLDVDHEGNDFSLHHKITQLSSKIITTNYDTAFENNFPLLRKNTAYKGKNYELTKHKEPHARLLFKLHGCYLAGDSMVLFPSNYKDLYENEARDAEHSLLVLRNIVMNNSLLFIGTGMGDFQINNIFQEIKRLQGDYNQKHFIITNKTLDRSLDFLTPIQIENHSDIDSAIDLLLHYKSDCKAEESERVKELEEQLETMSKELDELKKKSNPNREDLLEEEAIKYFMQGVVLSLDKDYNEANVKYERSTELKPDFFEAFGNWGNNLADLAENTHGEEADLLFQSAFEKYQKVIEIKPTSHKAYYNWGTHLGTFAKTQQAEKAAQLYLSAFEKYQKAIEIKSDYHEAFYNLGNHLGTFAKTQQAEKAAQLYLSAFEKYQKAIEIKPDYHEAFNNWGTDLGTYAKTQQAEKAAQLYLSAFEKYQKAIEIKSDYHEAFNNWGTFLCYYSEIVQNSEKSKELSEEAIEKIQKAVENGSSSYNLSCLYAIKQNKKDALKYLRDTLEKGHIQTQFVLQDEDWKAYWEDPDFLALIDEFQK